MADESAEGLPDAADPSDAAASPSRTALAHLAFALSLPERTLRGGSGLVGGLVRESAELLVPQSFQNSRTYTSMVRQMLDFMVHDIGGVPTGDTPSCTAEIDNYVARKAVGNFLDMASLTTLHLSPLVVLAAVSDLAYGSQSYLKELAEELKKQGVIDSHSHIDSVNDLLGAISKTTASTSDALNTPPLSLDVLKQTINETGAAIALNGIRQMPSRLEVDRLWRQMREVSQHEGVDLLALGGAMTMQAMDRLATLPRGARHLSRGALSSASVAAKMFDRHIVDHYSQALGELQEKGLYRSVAESSGPYIAAVWDNYQSSRSTVTEDLLSGKLLGQGWRTVRGWLGQRSDPASNPNDLLPPTPDKATETP